MAVRRAGRITRCVAIFDSRQRLWAVGSCDRLRLHIAPPGFKVSFEPRGPILGAYMDSPACAVLRNKASMNATNGAVSPIDER